jgi:integrase
LPCVLSCSSQRDYSPGPMLAATSETGSLSGRLERPSGVAEAGPPAPRRPRLLDVVREALRVRHYSRRTERAYVGWIRRYVLFHGKRHPAEMGAQEVSRFLSWLAVEGRVTASAQNQALAALLFLYGPVLGVELPWLDELARAAGPPWLPVVLSRDEVRAVLLAMHGIPRLMGVLLYGAGLRLLECARLRIKDVDFAANQIVVRSGKGDRDRVTLLPGLARSALERHLERVRAQHARDLATGAGWVELPHALSRKYPNAGREWPRQGVSRDADLRRAYDRPTPAPSPAGDRGAARGAPGGARGRADQGRLVPHVPPLVRHAPAGGRLRHQDGPRAAGAPGRADNHDLHARTQPGPGGGAVAGRRVGGGGPDGARPRCRRGARALHRGATQCNARGWVPFGGAEGAGMTVECRAA